MTYEETVVKGLTEQLGEISLKICIFYNEEAPYYKGVVVQTNGNEITFKFYLRNENAKTDIS